MDALPAHAREPIESFLASAQAAGASVTWTSYGPSLRVRHLPARVIAYAERGRVGIVIKPPKGFLPGPFETAHAEIDRLGLGVASADDREHGVRYDGATEQQLTAYLAIAVDLLRSLSPDVSLEPLDRTVTAQFERNDNIIWVKSVSALVPYVGKRLRGTLRKEGADRHPTILEPLKGDQPGWLPRLTDPSAQAPLWPPNVHSGSYELRIDAAA